MEFIFALRAAVSEIPTDFQNCDIWHETCPLAKAPHTHSLYPRGSKLSLFSVYRQQFMIYGPIFKTAMFGHKSWPLTNVPTILYILYFPPQWVEIELIFCFMWSGFRDTGPFSKLPYLGIKLGNWPMLVTPDVAHILSFHPRGRNWGYFALPAAVSEIRAFFFKTAILGHDTWQVAKFQELHILSFYPRELKLSLLFPLREPGFRYTGQFSKLPYFGMKLGKWPKFQKLHTCNLNYSRVPNFTSFCFPIARFPNNCGFWFRYRVQWWIWFSKKKNVKNQKLNISKIPTCFVRTIGKKFQEKFESF